MSDDTKAGCLVAILALVLLIPIYILNGWALMLLWGWFAVPVFAGLPYLSLAQAIGISMLAARLTGGTSYYKGHEVDTLKQFGIAIATPLFAVAIGWILRGFIVGG